MSVHGQEMTVSQAPDYRGDIKMLDLSAIFALCDALQQMTALTELKCTCSLLNPCPNLEANTSLCRFPDATLY